MNHLEGVVGSACKWMRLDSDAQTVHHLTARTLPNELCDHSVSDREPLYFESLFTHVESVMAYLRVVDLGYDIENLEEGIWNVGSKAAICIAEEAARFTQSRTSSTIRWW